MGQAKKAERLSVIPPDGWLDRPQVYSAKRRHLELLGILGMRRDKNLILDAGCGPGTYGVILAQEGFTVVGVDISGAAVSKAKERASREGLSFYPMEGDLESLPFGDGAFGLVFSGWVLHHFPSLGNVCSELCRVLKPGGRIAIAEPNESNLAVKVSRFAEDVFRPAVLGAGWDTPNRTVHGYRDYLGEFRKGGIVDLRCFSCRTNLPPILDSRSPAKTALELAYNLRACLFGLGAWVLPRPLNGSDLLITGRKGSRR
jgi:SAM-dependent methyltransferase